jgi:hypothetical protein
MRGGIGTRIVPVMNGDGKQRTIAHLNTAK